MFIDDRSLNGQFLAGQISGFEGAPRGYVVRRETYVYAVPVFSNLAAASAAGSTGNNILQMQQDSDFEWAVACYQYDLAAAPLTWATNILPNCTIQIADSGSQMLMFSAAVHVGVFFGPIERPRKLPITKVFKANSTITFTAQNVDVSASTGNLRLFLIGWKLKYFPDQRPSGEQLPQQV